MSKTDLSHDTTLRPGTPLLEADGRLLFVRRRNLRARLLDALLPGLWLLVGGLAALLYWW